MKTKYFFIYILTIAQQSIYCEDIEQKNSEEIVAEEEVSFEESLKRATATIDLFKEMLINTDDMDESDKKDILRSHDHLIALYNKRIEKLKKSLIKTIRALENGYEKNTVRAEDENLVDHGATKIAIAIYKKNKLVQLNQERMQKIIKLFEQAKEKVIHLHNQLESKMDTYYLKHTAAEIEKSFGTLIKEMQK